MKNKTKAKPLNKLKISFFENIIYWIWYYSLKHGAIDPWRFGRAITTILKFSNAAILLFAVFKIVGIDSEETVPLILASLFIFIFYADMIIYGSKKYYSKRTAYYTVWDVKYCILTERYGYISKERKRKYKTVFFSYLVITIVTDVFFFVFKCYEL
jgi:hypothetical protein